MKGRLKKIFRCKKGMSTPLTVALVLCLLLFLCVFAEYFRLLVIASGVRNAMQSADISVATTNYNEVYNGLREGYSGAYWYEDGWEENLDYGDIYTQLDNLLGLDLEEGNHMKWREKGYEYRISGLEVEITNVPIAPGNASRNFEVKAEVQLEVPLSFGWDSLPPLTMAVRTKAAYMPKF